MSFIHIEMITSSSKVSLFWSVIDHDLLITYWVHNTLGR